MANWHQIALQSGFRDSGSAPQEELAPLLKQVGIQKTEDLQAIIDGLEEAKGRYYLRKIRAFSSNSNIEAAPAYLIRHFLYLISS